MLRKMLRLNLYKYWYKMVVRSRIIDVLRKLQKCPVCGGRVVDIIYGTGDMTSDLEC